MEQSRKGLCSVLSSRSVVLVLLDSAHELAHGALEVVVHDADVIAGRAGHLLPGAGEATLDGGLVLGAAPAQATLELLGAGRLDEDEHGVGKGLAHVEASLHVDLEHHGASLPRDALDLLAQRAVAMPVDPRPLEELARRDATVELVLGEEVVGDAVLLARSWLSCSRRNRQAQAREALAQQCDERPLAHA